MNCRYCNGLVMARSTQRYKYKLFCFHCNTRNRAKICKLDTETRWQNGKMAKGKNQAHTTCLRYLFVFVLLHTSVFLSELCPISTYNLNSSSFSSIFLCCSFWLRLSNVDGELEILQSYLLSDVKKYPIKPLQNSNAI